MKLTLIVTASAATIAALIDVSRDAQVHTLNIESPSGDILGRLAGDAAFETQQELPLHTAVPASTLVAGNTLVPIMQHNVQDVADDGPVDTGAPEFDSAGVPWDARIHASSKATVTDGTWRARRNVDKAVIEAVTAELLGQQQPEPAAAPMPMPVMPVMPMPVVEAQPEAMPMPITPPVEPTPMPLPPPVEAVVPVTTGPITIPEFMQHLSIQMTGPDAKITNEYLAEAVGKFNAAYGTTFVTVNDFFTAPDKLPALVQMITLDGKW